MLAGLDGVLFRRQAEGVKAHRVQHAPPSHPLKAADDVRRRVPLRMPHMQPRAAGIREHIESVELLPRRHFGSAESLVLCPVLLPLGLDGGGSSSGA